MMRSKLIPLLLAAVVLAALFAGVAPVAAQENGEKAVEYPDSTRPFPSNPNKLYISVDAANVRTAPTLSAPVVFKFPKDDYVLVTWPVVGEEVDGNKTWYRTMSGYYISETVTTNEPSTQVHTFAGRRADRWIQVDLSDGVARAMLGNQAVYEAKVATGRPGYDTPIGTFKIEWRVETRTMDSSTVGTPLSSPKGYLIPFVRYAQYFTNQGHALHGNFWVPPDIFGSGKTSRGCVGMSNEDAKVLWDFGYVGMKVVIQE